MTGWRSCKYSRSPQGIYHNQGRVQKKNVKREIKDVTQIRHSVVRPQICNTPRDTLHVRRWFVFQQWEAKCSRGVRSVCQCLLLSIIINLVCIFKSFIPNKKCFLLDFFFVRFHAFFGPNDARNTIATRDIPGVQSNNRAHVCALQYIMQVRFGACFTVKKNTHTMLCV